jgi:hypothetical protein
MEPTYRGRHYETGTLADALAAIGARDPRTGQPYSEALVLGASGGIAFGYFTFEYKGDLPHVALLPRNTFAPFERALDNLAIRREVRETTQAERGERNLRQELDAGNPAIVWADEFSLPYRGLPTEAMWSMRPLLVVGQDGDDFSVVDGSREPVRIAAADLSRARARVKKDRFRMMTIERPDEAAMPSRLLDAMRTCVALALDKPPAGSADNFGISGMRHFAQVLTQTKGGKSWAKVFEPGPRLVQALAGRHGQPGVWDWIETWGTEPGADRGTYARFLREAVGWTGLPELGSVADAFEFAATLWRRLAEESQPDTVPEFAALKRLKRTHVAQWIERGRESDAERDAIREEMRRRVEAAAGSEVLAREAEGIRIAMAKTVLEIAEVENAAFGRLRAALDSTER